ncbi:MAG TPA: molybdate ABC transporter substrate-binding protein [Thermodesulfobacteriota bacterium]|nr:molybdate ABC transporter substrate-binding protein [Thermodesulfobacteriota bacterium]
MPASAAEIKILAPIPLQGVLEDLAPRFEKASGHKVSITFGLGVKLTKRMEDGEAADLFLGTRGNINGLIKAGRLVPGSDVTLARSSVGIAVRKGAPKPDISTPGALKCALIAAKSISYSNPAFGGVSGVHFSKVIERLGLVEEMKPKTRFPPEGGFAARLLATGEAELAVQLISELILVSEAEVIGPLPGDLQGSTIYAVAIPSAANQPEAARAMIKYLQSPEATTIMKAKGFDLVAESR